jgi:cell wall-associated NlpC family hydrolase
MAASEDSSEDLAGARRLGDDALVLLRGSWRFALAVFGAALTGAGCASTSPQASRWTSPSPPHLAPTSRPGEAALAFARAQLGKPYCWGGRGARCFDCSGLTQAAWSAAGYSIPRTSSDQARKLPEVALSNLRPGDILWRPGHVGLYAGEGRVIVRYQRADAFKRALRP